jgi:lysophospholipase L1-like esterase
MTTAALRQQVSKGFDVRPTLVTLSIGGNDLMLEVDDQQFAQNYIEIIRLLKKSGSIIVITNLPDISLAPALPNRLRANLNHRLLLFNKHIEYIARSCGLPLVDLYGASSKIIKSHREFFSSDGFHPSDAGYEFWAQAMWPTVEEVISGSQTVLQRTL